MVPYLNDLHHYFDFFSCIGYFRSECSWLILDIVFVLLLFSPSTAGIIRVVTPAVAVVVAVSVVVVVLVEAAAAAAVVVVDSGCRWKISTYGQIITHECESFF